MCPLLPHLCMKPWLSTAFYNCLNSQKFLNLPVFMLVPLSLNTVYHYDLGLSVANELTSVTVVYICTSVCMVHMVCTRMHARKNSPRNNLKASQFPKVSGRGISPDPSSCCILKHVTHARTPHTHTHTHILTYTHSAIVVVVLDFSPNVSFYI